MVRGRNRVNMRIGNFIYLMNFYQINTEFEMQIYIYLLAFFNPKWEFWTPGKPEGVLSNRPCLCSVVHWSVFKYLRDRLLVFSNFLTEVRVLKGTKVTEPDF